MKRIFFAAIAACAAHSALALTFSGPTNLATGPNPDGIAAADFNGDGVKDLAISVDTPDRVQVFLGTGGGTFAAPVNYATGAGTGPGTVRAGDVDGDLDTDLIVALHNTNQLLLLRNNGAGVFALAGTAATGANPVEMTMGDLNGDGRPDAITINRDGNSITVLMNNGTGAFSPTSFGAGNDPRGGAMGDLDGDGDNDFVVTNHADRTIGVYFNNGAGSMSSPTTYSVGANLRGTGVVIAKLDADADNDVAVATSGNGLNFVSVFTNGGTGALSGPANFGSGGQNPDSLAAADLDGDGDNDIVVTNQDSNQLGLLTNNGNATFAAAQTMATGTTPEDIIATDLNGDFVADVALVNKSSSNASLYFNAGVPIIVSPSAFSVFRGALIGGGLADLFGSDNSRVVIRAGFTVSPTEDNVQLIVEGVSSSTTASSITFKVESSTNLANRTQTIYMWDFTGSQYVAVDTRAGTTTDSVTEVTVSVNASRFIASDGTMRAKISLGPWRSVLLGPWTGSYDQVSWTVRN